MIFKKIRRKLERVEEREQMAFVEWLKLTHRDLLYTCSLCGVYMPVQIRLKFHRLGYANGTPDFLIFEPRGKYHGLLIELKRPKNADSEKGRTRPEQLVFAAELKARGYAAVVCYGFEEAKNTLEKYLNLKDGE